MRKNRKLGALDFGARHVWRRNTSLGTWVERAPPRPMNFGVGDAAQHGSRTAVPASEKLQPLTGIRGVAACWVVGFHAATNLGPALGGFPGRDTIILRSGFLAVDLFFMLSGFVLAYSYFSRFCVDRGLALRDFAIGRLFRVLPLNWAMLVVLLLVSTAFPSRYWSNEPLTAPSFWAAMALVQAWGMSSATSWNFPACSLSAEWAAYFLFPLLLVMIRWADTAARALGMGLAGLLLLCAIMIGIGGGTLEHSWLLGLPRCFLQFIAGAFLWRALDLGVVSRRHAETIMLMGLAGVVLVIIVPRAELVAPFAFGSLILACAMKSRLATLLFANPTVLFLGDISFSIYLSHAIILSGGALLAVSLGLDDGSLLARSIFLVVVCAAGLGVSYLAWQVIERPGQAAGRAWQRRLARRTAAGELEG